MAQFTITSNAQANLPPSVVGDNTINTDLSTTYVFTLADFTTNTTPVYTDPEGDPVLSLRVESVPATGELQLSGSPVSIGNEITATSISGGLFTYVPSGVIAYMETFDYTLADTGSLTYSLDTGTITADVALVTNQPPTAVGDNDVTINYATTRIFTRADFTTDTTPAYSDPEGDPADLLRITLLPGQGEIRLNNVPIVLNQVINFSDIDSGFLTYVSDAADLDGYSVSFEFEIADSGSGMFVG